MESPQRDFIAQLARDANQFASVAPRLQRGLGNVVAGIVDQLSTSPLDFVYQLLQNADDKEYDVGVVPEMGFVIKPTRQGGFVHAWDNGLPLSNEQVEALVTFRSTKRDDKATIGEKGVGWHSVFRVSNEPHVYSGGYSFKLGGLGFRGGLESMLTPQWVEESDLPFAPQPGTNFYLPLRELDDATLRDLDALHQRFSPLTLLFLRKLRRVHIEAQRFAVELEGDVWTVRTMLATERIERVVQQVIVIRPQASAVPAEIQTRDPHIVLAFPLVASGGQNLFAWLPVMASGLKFLVHADFVTTLSRESLLADAWNAWLWGQMPAALAGAVQQLVASAEAPLYSKWLDLWPTGELHLPELRAAIEEAERLLRDLPVIATSRGLRAPTECILATEEERRLLPDAELARVGQHYPLELGSTAALTRLGARPFELELVRRYVEEHPDALLRRYQVEEKLLDRMVQYLQAHDIREVAFLPVSTREGPRLQALAAQLLASTEEETRRLADMGLPVVLVRAGRSARAWLEGMGLRRVTPESVLDAILAGESFTDPAESVLQAAYLHSVWDDLSSASRARLAREFLVWTESSAGDALRVPIQVAHIRDGAMVELFGGMRPNGGGAAAGVRYLAEAYDAIEATALRRLGAWPSPRLEERVVEVQNSHRNNPLLDQWLESEKLPATANGYTFRYWAFPDCICKFIEEEGGKAKIAFLELLASHWDTYEARRSLCLQHTWRSKRCCPHGKSSCEECVSTKMQHWDLPPFLQRLRAMRVPTSLGSEKGHWRKLEETMLLPARERARLGGLQLPLPALVADINSSAFLRACGVATEVSPDILLRGLLQLRERPPSDELLRQVQAFYSLLERVTSDDAFQLTDDWPVLASDPCPRELERRALEGARGDVRERQAALHSEIRQNLRWFALREVRWDGPARVVAGHFALLSQQRTSDARRVYTQFVADVLRVPDVGPGDLVEVLDQLARRRPLGKEDVEKAVLIYEELAQYSRQNCLDEALLARVRKRLLTHRHVFVSGLVFACDNPGELGLAQQPDIHFLHFPQAVAAHPRFLAQLGIPLAKDVLRETYVGQAGSIDRHATDILRGRLEWLARSAVHLSSRAKSLPASDWAALGELARVEVVPEVLVKVELGPAQTQRRVSHAVDWSPQRCAVILGREQVRARTTRGQRVLAAGVADLLSTMCGTSTTTELLRLVGLVLTTPLKELDELSEDERLPALPPSVRAALGQRQVGEPAALLAPLRDGDEREDEEGQQRPAPPLGPPPGPPPGLPVPPGASQPPQAEDEEGDDDEVLAAHVVLAEEDVGAASEPGAADAAGDGAAAQAAGEAVAKEAARLRLEAALEHEDAAAAQRALRDLPPPLDAELVRRVQRLVRHQNIVASLRKAVKLAPSRGVDLVRRAVRAAEKTGSRSAAIAEAMQEARKCIQELEKASRREAAVASLRGCADAGAAELEAALTEAWEAGVEEGDADFAAASARLGAAQVREACAALEAALQADAGAVVAAAARLRMWLAQAGEAERAQGLRLLRRADAEQAATQALAAALASTDADAVRVALEAVREVPMAAAWVGQAEQWLRQSADLEHRRAGLLQRLEVLASGCDVEDLAAALRLGRELCGGELAPYEALYAQRAAQAEQARAALFGAHHVELLGDVLAALPPGVLPEAEVAQWRGNFEEWEVRVATMRAEFDFAAHQGQAEETEQAYSRAMKCGAGPRVLEAMQQVLHGAREQQQLVEQHQAAQAGWWREQQAAAWRKHLQSEKDLSLRSLEDAIAFATQEGDEALQRLAEGARARMAKVEEFWRVAERSEAAADWRVAAIACRSSQQLRRSEDAEARARLAEAREGARRDLAASTEADLLPALQRAQELGLPEQSLAPARERIARSGRPATHAGGAPPEAPRRPEAPRTRQKMLPGEYSANVLGKWERVSPYGAEVLQELGLLREESKLRWGSAELPLSVVTKPQGYSTVEGDVLGKELRRIERKLNDISSLEEKILKKEKLSQEEWHKVAHKTLYLQEHRMLQAKLAASGAEQTDFAEVWEAVCMVRDRTGADPFHRHLLEGAPAEPVAGGLPPIGAGPGAHLEAGASRRIGALGELYVFTWLGRLLGEGEGFGFENWCSSCRSAHPEAPPAEPDADRFGCDFRFYDAVGIFCRGREVLLEVKTMRVAGDPSAARATDFSCRISTNELAVMREVGESDRAYYVMLWVVVGDNLACRVVAVLRQPHSLIPCQLSLRPTEFSASLSSKFGPPGLTLEEDPQTAMREI